MATITGTNKADMIAPFSVSPGVSESPTQCADQIRAGNGNDSVVSASGDDQVQGDNGDDNLRAGPGNDTVEGGNGDDWLDGEDGNDVLDAGRGDDWVHGGFGVDVLTGGNGADTFAFGSWIGTRVGPRTRSDTGVGEGARDEIRDFQQGSDVIDLTLLNFSGVPDFPETYVDTRQFEFISTAEFTVGGGDTPQLRYFVANGKTIVQMDGIANPFLNPRTDTPDGLVDAEIALTGEFVLRPDDFIL